MKSYFSIFIVFAAALAQSCAFDHKKELDSKTATSALLDRAVPYSEVFQTVFAPRCVSCHSQAGGNQGGINLETYESTFPLAASIERAALTSKTMPKGQALSDTESQILATWLGQGATRGGSSEQASSKLRGPLTWMVIRDEIFEKKCLDCHSQPRPEKDLDLSTFEITKANITKIFDRAVVIQDMPMAPIEHLTVEEKQALAQWIAQGMPQ